MTWDGGSVGWFCRGLEENGIIGGGRRIPAEWRDCQWEDETPGVSWRKVEAYDGTKQT